DMSIGEDVAVLAHDEARAFASRRRDLPSGNRLAEAAKELAEGIAGGETRNIGDLPPLADDRHVHDRRTILLDERAEIRQRRCAGRCDRWRRCRSDFDRMRAAAKIAGTCGERDTGRYRSHRSFQPSRNHRTPSLMNAWIFGSDS